MGDKDILVNNDYVDRNYVGHTSGYSDNQSNGTAPSDVTAPSWLQTDHSVINREGHGEHPAEPDEQETRADPRRWYILIVFSLVSMTQGKLDSDLIHDIHMTVCV